MLFFRPPPHLTSSVHFNLNSAQSRSVVVLCTRISCAVACSLLFIFVETCLNTFSFSLSLLLRRPSLSLFVHRTCLNCLTSPYRRRGKRKKKKPNRFTKQKRTMSVNNSTRVQIIAMYIKFRLTHHHHHICISIYLHMASYYYYYHCYDYCSIVIIHYINRVICGSLISVRGTHLHLPMDTTYVGAHIEKDCQ